MKLIGPKVKRQNFIGYKISKPMIVLGPKKDNIS